MYVVHARTMYGYIIINKSDLAIAWVKEEAELIKSFTLL